MRKLEIKLSNSEIISGNNVLVPGYYNEWRSTNLYYSTEEYKIINETRKILNRPNLKITATTVRVPVINSHSESINVEFEKDFDNAVFRSTHKEVFEFLKTMKDSNDEWEIRIVAVAFLLLFVLWNKVKLK